MIYIHKNNGTVAVKAEKISGAYLVTLEDGSIKEINEGTFKRWWKKVESPEVVEVTDNNPDPTKCLSEDEALEQAVVDPDDKYVEEIMEQKKNLGIECPEIKEVELVPMPGIEKLADLKEEYCGDGTTYEQVGKEKAAKAKKAAKKKEKTPSTSDALCEQVYSIVNGFGDEIFKPAKDLKMRTFKVGGHMYAKFNYSKTGITLAVKSAAVKEIKNIREPYAKLNHMFDWAYRFTGESLSPEDEAFITEILTASREFRITRNANATKKTKKEEN